MIELEDVWYSYGRGYVIKGVSWRFEDGRAYAVIGRNGSGKSTLLKLMAGLLRPSRGRVLISGRDASRMRPGELIREVGIVFQNPDYQLFEETVYREVEFALRNLGVQDRGPLVERALERLGLRGLEGRAPLTLSGGEKKRLTIASAIAWGPRALLLDEPTVGQDSAFKELLIGLIREHAGSGGLAVVSTHDMEFLWRLNPTALLIEGGGVVCADEFRRLAMQECFLRAFGSLPGLASMTLALGLQDPIGDDEEAVRVIRGLL